MGWGGVVDVVWCGIGCYSFGCAVVRAWVEILISGWVGCTGKGVRLRDEVKGVGLYGLRLLVWVLVLVVGRDGELRDGIRIRRTQYLLVHIPDYQALGCRMINMV